MTKTRLSLSIVVGLVLMLTLPAWADFQEGLDAYKRGDYDTALKEWRPLADQGLAAAQNNLGAMYINGEGVRRNYVQGYMWLSLAAKQGYKRAVSSQGQLEREMTPGELAEAERFAREWTPKGRE